MGTFFLGHPVCVRDEWVSLGIRNLLPESEEPFKTFDKEDMSDQFSRAMLEKMQLVGMT